MTVASIVYILYHLSNIILNLMIYLIIASVAASWFQVDRYNPYLRILDRLTEPLYRFPRIFLNQVLRLNTGPIDLAPMLTCFILVFLAKAVPFYLLQLHKQLLAQSSALY